jgi:hypothetical protein
MPEVNIKSREEHLAELGDLDDEETFE